MSILGIIIAIVLIVFALWLIQTYLPAPWKTPALLIVVVLALVWIAMVLWPGLSTARVGR